MSGQRADRYARARATFAVAHMSDAKWRKVFTALATADLGLTRAEWKFIDADRVYDWGLPAPADLRPDRLADGRFQPVAYKWIEWIRFPRSDRPNTTAPGPQQDLAGLLRVLRAVGPLQLEYDEDGLTVFGYSR